MSITKPYPNLAKPCQTLHEPCKRLWNQVSSFKKCFISGNIITMNRETSNILKSLKAYKILATLDAYYHNAMHVKSSRQK